MKQATAANLAVLFVALAWMALFIGATLLIADPRPGTPSAEIEATRHLALAIECVGYLLILCSICYPDTASSRQDGDRYSRCLLAL